MEFSQNFDYGVQWHLVCSQHNIEIEGDNQNDSEVWGKQTRSFAHNFP
jgi:hypothetical protein